MPLLSQQDAEHLKNEFESHLVNPVKLVVFYVGTPGIKLTTREGEALAGEVE